ncbi:hypothetical protein IAT40_001534 [Kwoniella sp. CBS 6097]
MSSTPPRMPTADITPTTSLPASVALLPAIAEPIQPLFTREPLDRSREPSRTPSPTTSITGARAEVQQSSSSHTYTSASYGSGLGVTRLSHLYGIGTSRSPKNDPLYPFLDRDEVEDEDKNKGESTSSDPQSALPRVVEPERQYERDGRSSSQEQLLPEAGTTQSPEEAEDDTEITPRPNDFRFVSSSHLDEDPFYSQTPSPTTQSRQELVNESISASTVPAALSSPNELEDPPQTPPLQSSSQVAQLTHSPATTIAEGQTTYHPPPPGGRVPANRPNPNLAIEDPWEDQGTLEEGVKARATVDPSGRREAHITPRLDYQQKPTPLLHSPTRPAASGAGQNIPPRIHNSARQALSDRVSRARQPDPSSDGIEPRGWLGRLGITFKSIRRLIAIKLCCVAHAIDENVNQGAPAPSNNPHQARDEPHVVGPNDPPPYDVPSPPEVSQPSQQQRLPKSPTSTDSPTFEGDSATFASHGSSTVDSGSPNVPGQHTSTDTGNVTEVVEPQQIPPRTADTSSTITTPEQAQSSTPFFAASNAPSGVPGGSGGGSGGPPGGDDQKDDNEGRKPEDRKGKKARRHTPGSSSLPSSPAQLPGQSHQTATMAYPPSGHQTVDPGPSCQTAGASGNISVTSIGMQRNTGSGITYPPRPNPDPTHDPGTSHGFGPMRWFRDRFGTGTGPTSQTQTGGPSTGQPGTTTRGTGTGGEAPSSQEMTRETPATRLPDPLPALDQGSSTRRTHNRRVSEGENPPGHPDTWSKMADRSDVHKQAKGVVPSSEYENKRSRSKKNQRPFTAPAAGSRPPDVPVQGCGLPPCEWMKIIRGRRPSERPPPDVPLQDQPGSSQHPGDAPPPPPGPPPPGLSGQPNVSPPEPSPPGIIQQPDASGQAGSSQPPGIREQSKDPNGSTRQHQSTSQAEQAERAKQAEQIDPSSGQEELRRSQSAEQSEQNPSELDRADTQQRQVERQARADSEQDEPSPQAQQVTEGQQTLHINPADQQEVPLSNQIVVPGVATDRQDILDLLVPNVQNMSTSIGVGETLLSGADTTDTPGQHESSATTPLVHSFGQDVPIESAPTSDPAAIHPDQFNKAESSRPSSLRPPRRPQRPVSAPGISNLSTPIPMARAGSSAGPQTSPPAPFARNSSPGLNPTIPSAVPTPMGSLPKSATMDQSASGSSASRGTFGRTALGSSPQMQPSGLAPAIPTPQELTPPLRTIDLGDNGRSDSSRSGADIAARENASFMERRPLLTDPLSPTPSSGYQTPAVEGATQAENHAEPPASAADSESRDSSSSEVEVIIPITDARGEPAGRSSRRATREEKGKWKSTDPSSEEEEEEDLPQNPASEDDIESNAATAEDYLASTESLDNVQRPDPDLAAALTKQDDSPTLPASQHQQDIPTGSKLNASTGSRSTASDETPRPPNHAQVEEPLSVSTGTPESANVSGVLEAAAIVQGHDLSEQGSTPRPSGFVEELDQGHTLSRVNEEVQYSDFQPGTPSTTGVSAYAFAHTPRHEPHRPTSSLPATPSSVDILDRPSHPLPPSTPASPPSTQRHNSHIAAPAGNATSRALGEVVGLITEARPFTVDVGAGGLLEPPMIISSASALASYQTSQTSRASLAEGDASDEAESSGGPSERSEEASGDEGVGATRAGGSNTPRDSVLQGVPISGLESGRSDAHYDPFSNAQAGPSTQPFTISPTVTSAAPATAQQSMIERSTQVSSHDVAAISQTSTSQTNTHTEAPGSDTEQAGSSVWAGSKPTVSHGTTTNPTSLATGTTNIVDTAGVAGTSEGVFHFDDDLVNLTLESIPSHAVSSNVEPRIEQTSRHGSPIVSPLGGGSEAEGESEQGSGHGSGHGNTPRSVIGDEHGSRSASEYESDQQSEHGARQGSEHTSESHDQPPPPPPPPAESPPRGRRGRVRKAWNGFKRAFKVE